MQCPTDGAVLVMSERSGLEIDDRRYDQGSPRRKEKDNWLSELFD